MIGTLYFLSSRGEKRLVAADIDEKEVSKEIHDFIESINPDYQVHYMRVWENEEGHKMYDVGSWTEFFEFDYKR